MRPPSTSSPPPSLCMFDLSPKIHDSPCVAISALAHVMLSPLLSDLLNLTYLHLVFRFSAAKMSCKGLSCLSQDKWLIPESVPGATRVRMLGSGRCPGSSRE